MPWCEQLRCNSLKWFHASDIGSSVRYWKLWIWCLMLLVFEGRNNLLRKALVIFGHVSIFFGLWPWIQLFVLSTKEKVNAICLRSSSEMVLTLIILHISSKFVRCWVASSCGNPWNTCLCTIVTHPDGIWYSSSRMFRVAYPKWISYALGLV
jgi:hypothetical protein